MASKPPDQVPASLTLPTSVVTPSDVGRMVRELESLDNTLLQLKVREGGIPTELPDLSIRLGKMVELNKLNLLHSKDRHSLQAVLLTIKDKAPVLHISFSSEPNSNFLDKLIVWIRREINPQTLLTIGLQPAIGAGCMVRTTNHYFDLSLRQTFIDKRPLLLEQIIPAAPGPGVA